MELKNLTPTDDVCLVKSLWAAKKEFFNKGHQQDGAIQLCKTLLRYPQAKTKFGIYTQPQIIALQWVCHLPNNQFLAVPAFQHDEDYSIYTEAFVLETIPVSTLFEVKNKIFCLEYDKKNDLTIFSLSVIDNEKTALEVAKLCYGVQKCEISLNRFKSYFNKNEYIVWLIEDIGENEQEPNCHILAAFCKEQAKINQCPKNTHIYAPLPEFYVFEKDDMYFYTSTSAENGQCFLKATPLPR